MSTFFVSVSIHNPCIHLEHQFCSVNVIFIPKGQIGVPEFPHRSLKDPSMLCFSAVGHFNGKWLINQRKFVFYIIIMKCTVFFSPRQQQQGCQKENRCCLHGSFRTEVVQSSGQWTCNDWNKSPTVMPVIAVFRWQWAEPGWSQFFKYLFMFSQRQVKYHTLVLWHSPTDII